MDPVRNPFTPGAGAPPQDLFGREAVLREAEVLFARVQKKRPEKSMILTGLRGVGKTVLLNEMERRAKKLGYYTISLEAQEGGRRLGELLAPRLRNLFYELNRIAKAGLMVRRGLMVLRNFITSIHLSYGDFGLDLEALPGVADTGNLEMDLPDLLLAVADAAQERETAVAIFIDEIQNLTEEEMRSLNVSMHRLQQRQGPLVLLGAGLPTIPKLAGDALSYAERLFSYPIIGQLSKKSSVSALQLTAKHESVSITDKAAASVYSRTAGYPYFLQEWGYQMWNVALRSPIGEDVVSAVEDKVLERLDTNFFRVRYDRLTDGEKRFMRAMAEFPPNGCRTGELAEVMHSTSTQIAPVRARLMKKGMIFSPQHGVMRFSVPMFGDFLRRAIPSIPD